MPLSEHEQRMLDEIESALYAEDPRFVSAVRGRGRAAWVPSTKRRLQAVFVMAVGLVLLIIGIAVPVLRIGGDQGFSAVSVLGFLVMFAGGIMLIFGVPWGGKSEGDDAPAAPRSRGSGGEPRQKRAGKTRSGGGFATRMEERFRRRFEE